MKKLKKRQLKLIAQSRHGGHCGYVDICFYLFGGTNTLVTELSVLCRKVVNTTSNRDFQVRVFKPSSRVAKLRGLESLVCEPFVLVMPVSNYEVGEQLKRLGFRCNTFDGSWKLPEGIGGEGILEPRAVIVGCFESIVIPTNRECTPQAWQELGDSLVRLHVTRPRPIKPSGPILGTVTECLVSQTRRVWGGLLE